MTSSEPRTGLLRRLTRRGRVAAASEALARATGEAGIAAAAAELIELAAQDDGGPRAGGAVVELVRRWERVPDALRERAAAAGQGRWESACRELVADGDSAVRRGVAALAMASGDPGLAWVCATLLQDGDDVVAGTAGQGLVHLSAVAVAADRPGRNILYDAVAAAVRSFADHRRPEALRALVVLLDDPLATRRGGGIAAILEDDGHPAHAEVRAWIRRTDEDGLRARAWSWLRWPVLAPACLERLSRAAAVSDHEEVLSRAHLLHHPGRREEVVRLARRAAVRRGSSPLPDAGSIDSLSAEARAGLADWMGACGDGVDPAVTGRLARDESPAVRHRALRGAGGDAGARIRHDACFDADPRLARAALIASLDDVRPGGAAWGLGAEWARRAVESLRRSQHDGVRLIASAAAARWDPWDAGQPASRLAARRRLRQNRAGLLDAIRERLLGEGADEAISAIAMARAIGVISELEPALLPVLATDGAGRDARIVATIAAALGDADSADSHAALLRCLSHDDTRTRANATEALARRARRLAPPSGDAGAVLVELKRDPSHRVRANAIRGLLAAALPHLPSSGPRPPAAIDAERAAVQSLSDMLTDERPLHRIAALWVAEHIAQPGFWTRWGELPGRLATLASGEPEPAVRERAGRCARVVLTRIRAGWSAGAPGSFSAQV